MVALLWRYNDFYEDYDDNEVVVLLWVHIVEQFHNMGDVEDVKVEEVVVHQLPKDWFSCDCFHEFDEMYFLTPRMRTE